MMRVAIVQLRVAQSKRENIAAAVEKIAIAAKHGAELVVLPVAQRRAIHPSLL